MTSDDGDEAMTLPQGDLRLLGTEVATRLLASTVPARLAYVERDGTPRVVPSWFHWSGAAIVMATYVNGPAMGITRPSRRLAALRAAPTVALTIDTETFPPNVLQIRGRAEIDEVDGLAPEYVAAARRYLGNEAGSAMATQMNVPGTRQARIVVRPTWVGVLDFVTRPAGAF
ncbi:MAG: pyridoxamine 5'-phosphate oxidase family protein [Acidimicrobiia bacterium]